MTKFSNQTDCATDEKKLTQGYQRVLFGGHAQCWSYSESDSWSCSRAERWSCSFFLLWARPDPNPPSKYHQACSKHHGAELKPGGNQLLPHLCSGIISLNRVQNSCTFCDLLERELLSLNLKVTNNGSKKMTAAEKARPEGNKNITSFFTSPTLTGSAAASSSPVVQTETPCQSTTMSVPRTTEQSFG